MSSYEERKQLFEERRQKHDQKEDEVMNKIRPFTKRKHLPDRWIDFNGMLCAWDLKTNVFVEQNSHDEYFYTFENDGFLFVFPFVSDPGFPICAVNDVHVQPDTFTHCRAVFWVF